MNCNYCGKFIDNAIFGGNGKLYCPHCFSDLIASSLNSENIFLSAENTRLYANSELKFSKVFTSTDISNTEKAILRREAIETCKKAASAGNPFAMVAMGYYYENNYIEGDVDSRLCSAAQFYNMVASQNADYSEQILGIQGRAAVDEKMRDVIKGAIYNMYCLILNNTEIMKDNVFAASFKIKDTNKLLDTIANILINIDPNFEAVPAQDINLDTLSNEHALTKDTLYSILEDNTTVLLCCKAPENIISIIELFQNEGADKNFDILLKDYNMIAFAASNSLKVNNFNEVNRLSSFKSSFHIIFVRKIAEIKKFIAIDKNSKSTKYSVKLRNSLTILEKLRTGDLNCDKLSGRYTFDDLKIASIYSKNKLSDDETFNQLIKVINIRS